MSSDLTSCRVLCEPYRDLKESSMAEAELVQEANDEVRHRGDHHQTNGSSIYFISFTDLVGCYF